LVQIDDPDKRELIESRIRQLEDFVKANPELVSAKPPESPESGATKAP